MNEVVVTQMAKLLTSTLWRYLWAAPASAVGLLLALPLWLAGGRAQRCAGVLEVAAPPWRHLARLPFCAITLGHVVLGVSPAVLAQWRQCWPTRRPACGCGCVASAPIWTTRSNARRAARSATRAC